MIVSSDLLYVFLVELHLLFAGSVISEVREEPEGGVSEDTYPSLAFLS